jgi:hypothetical protein
VSWRAAYCSFCGVGRALSADGLYDGQGVAIAICRRCASKALAALDPHYRAALDARVVPMRPQPKEPA